MPLFENEQITQFFMATRNPRTTLGKDWLNKQMEVFSLVYRIIKEKSLGALSGEPPYEVKIERDGLFIQPESIEVLENGDVIFSIQDNKGKTLHVGITKNSVNAPFVSMESALFKLVHKLSNSSEERIDAVDIKQALNNVVAVVNINGNAVCFGPDKGILREIMAQTTGER
jgi:hypothetical protein